MEVGVVPRKSLPFELTLWDAIDNDDGLTIIDITYPSTSHIPGGPSTAFLHMAGIVRYRHTTTCRAITKFKDASQVQIVNLDFQTTWKRTVRVTIPLAQVADPAYVGTV